MLEDNDIQGLIFSAYATQPSASYLFFSIRDADQARAWLKEVLPHVTRGGTFERERKQSLNLAFTPKGLTQLGISANTLATFARPFVEGMAQPDRARQLGDEPKSWEWGTLDHRIHVLAMLFATDRLALDRLRAQVCERALAGGGLEVLFEIHSEDLPGSVEHFGFLDGLSQPFIEGYRPEKQTGSGPGNVIRAGEFILGYENEYGQYTNSPRLLAPDSDPTATLRDQDLGRNGTYLVLRQMEQDVCGFWQMIRSHVPFMDGAPNGSGEEALAAKVVGRWLDGTPITQSPDRNGAPKEARNNFGFDADRFGLRCPFGAHIRRANPRDALLKDAESSIATVKRHRLLRRGRPYGSQLGDRYTDDGARRGLLFVALNANIERQFEFVQHAWVSSPSFAGLYDEADPLLGGRTQTPGTFTVEDVPARQRLHGIVPHVSVKGGAYFFLPGLRALHYLSSMRPSLGVGRMTD